MGKYLIVLIKTRNLTLLLMKTEVILHSSASSFPLCVYFKVLRLINYELVAPCAAMCWDQYIQAQLRRLHLETKTTRKATRIKAYTT